MGSYGWIVAFDANGWGGRSGTRHEKVRTVWEEKCLANYPILLCTSCEHAAPKNLRFTAEFCVNRKICAFSGGFFTIMNVKKHVGYALKSAL